MSRLPQTDPDRPVLIAGPTASGKSELALNLAREQGGIIINADAIQVYENWRILTARPDAAETARAPHALYGHVAWDLPYSVGHWLRDVTPLLAGTVRPIIIGGTGLYFAALTEGLAEIPQTPPEIRAEAETILQSFGTRQLISDLDPDTVKRIDLQNPRRVQRAWEVARATGRGLAEWHADTPPPLLAATGAHRFLLDAPREWLTPRIETRFDQMLAAGALDEARANLDHYDPALPSMQAIGAADLMAHLTGQLSLDEAAVRATIATRQYAKRQRSWFRARMGDWQRIACSG